MMESRTPTSPPDYLSLWRRLGRLLLSWTVALTVLGALIYIGALVLASPFDTRSQAALIAFLPLAAGTAGLLLGSAQRKMLAPFLDLKPAWIWASALGLGLGLLAVMTLSAGIRNLVAEWTDGYRLTAFLVGAGLSGTLASLGQWLILRPSVPRHQWWLLANAVGWLMAWLALLAVGLFLGSGEPLPTTLDRWGHAAILGAVAGFMIGFEQGVALVGLLAQRVWEQRRKQTYPGMEF